MTALPKLIQRRSVPGWTMPEGAVDVSWPSKWGNPFRFGSVNGGLVREPGALTGQSWEYEGRISTPNTQHDFWHPDGRVTTCYVRFASRGEVVELFRRALLGIPDAALASAWGPLRPVKVTVDEVRAELAGRDLVCWCPLDQPCHRDVLWEVANDVAGSGTQASGALGP